MSHPAVAFAPRRCLEHRLWDVDTAWTQDATTLFVDLAGFTSLTERLSTRGSAGTEELSRLLRGFFMRVTDAVTELGGDPVAWGGDALTVLFDGPAQQGLAAATSAADRIGSLVGQAADIQTSAGPLDLKTRIGVARGPVTTVVARSPRRRLPIQIGSGLDLAVAAEARAHPGQVVVDPSAMAFTFDDRADSSPVEPATRTVEAATLSMLAPPVMLDRLVSGRSLLESHRPVTVAFARFNALQPTRLSAFVDLVGFLLSLVDDLGGELVQVSGGDKGNVAMAVFGAPLAHSDDAVRAVQAMLDLHRAVPSVAIGMASGPVFAALLGSNQRLFPTHSGVAVNLAARLMEAAAAGQILCDRDTWLAAANHLRRDGAPLLLRTRGQGDPIEVHSLAGWRRTRPRITAQPVAAIVGRAAELLQVEKFLDLVVDRTPTGLMLEGEPGIGKSRLAREVIDRASTRGFTVLAVDTETHPRGRSTGVWRDFVGGLVGVNSHSTSRRQWESALRSRLPHQLEPAALEPMLEIQLEGDVHRETLTPELAAELAGKVLAQLLSGSAEAAPLLVVVENGHHLDEGSLRMFSGLPGRLTRCPVGILMTRGHAAETTIDLRPAGWERITLDELTREQSHTLAAQTWRLDRGGSTPPWLAEAVYRRAGGVPLFVEIVTRSLRAIWEPGHPAPQLQSAGPLTGVLAERVDRLPVKARQMLDVLAVARRPCPPSVVADLLPNALDGRAVRRLATQLSSEHLVAVEGDGTQERYRLLHDLVRQVVYQSISHAERLRLHRRLVECLAAAGADAIEIAEHVTHLEDPELARRWFPEAAASARASWNLVEAAEWLERLLPHLSGEYRDVTEVELLEVLLVAGMANNVLDRASAWDSDDVTCRPVPPNAADRRPSDLVARQWHTVAEAALVCGDFARCEACAAKAMTLTDGVDERRHQRAAELLILARCHQGALHSAIRAGEEMLDRAVDAGDRDSITTAQAALGAALLISDQPHSAAVHYEAALRGALGSGNVVQEIHILSDLAGCAFETGRHADCVHLLEEARARADMIGYRRHLAFNLSNEAQLRAALADPFAAPCAAASVTCSLEMGDLTAAANTLHTWITSKPSLESDATLWKRLRNVDLQLRREAAAAQDSADLAVAAARSGDVQQALEAADSAAEAAERLGLDVTRRRAALARLLAMWRRSGARRSQPGNETLLASLDALAAETGVGEVEGGELAFTRWQVTRTADDRRSALAKAQLAFVQEPSEKVRHWIRELGQPLPAGPSALPPPVGIGRSRKTRAELDEALDRIEHALWLGRIPANSRDG
jgi:class 3 adenylate cyclase/tetratricopeptide (TPR) repeat protein